MLGGALAAKKRCMCLQTESGSQQEETRATLYFHRRRVRSTRSPHHVRCADGSVMVLLAKRFGLLSALTLVQEVPALATTYGRGLVL